MTPDQIPLLLLFLFPLAYSPGPGNMFFAALGARYGVAASLPATFGYHAATLIVSFAIGAGVTVALDPTSRSFTLIQTLGAIYLLWLAFKLYRSHNPQSIADARPATALDGAILLLLNPKGYLIMALLFTQFPGETLFETALVATLFTANNLLAFLVWIFAGQTLSRLFNSPAAAHRINTGFAICLAGVALWLLLTK